MDTLSRNPFPEILNELLTQESCKSAKNSWSNKPLKFKFVRFYEIIRSPMPTVLSVLRSFEDRQVRVNFLFVTSAIQFTW